MAKFSDAKKTVMCGIIDLIRHKVFYGHILQQLSKVYLGGPNAKLPTMAVGKQKDDLLIKLYINQDWLANEIFGKAKSEDQAWGFLLGALEHETLHVVFDHLNLKFSDRLRGNVAVDLVVNSCIDKDKLIEAAMLPDMFGFPPHKSSFWYYQQLKDNKQFQNMCAKGQFGVEGMFSDAVKSHDMWEEAASDPILKDIVKDIVRQAKELCNKDYGNVPAEVIEQIGDILKTRKPIIPWNKVLRTFVASATESDLDYTMKRVSKRFGTRPGTRKEDVLELAVAIDTSGSISDTQLKVFMNEIYWIYKNGAHIQMLECDCAITKQYRYKGKWNGQITGRGGTDLEPVLKEVEGQYDALIYFTDFYAPVINHKYQMPILWVLTTELTEDQYPYKWGKHVKIEVPSYD